MVLKSWLVLPLFAFALVGCAVVDQYSDRAITYNLEAEDALDQGLLLNVVRASYRRPMQFTSVQTISGQASASGTAGLTSIPIGPHSGITYKTGAITGTVSGGPTFTVPVLDTQEFYQGVMAPVSSQLFDFFIHEQFPREEILSLFIEAISISKQTPECIPPGRKSHTFECELVFVNNPDADIDFDLFQSLVEHLLNLGLTTESIPSSQASTQKSAGNCSSNANGASTASSTSTEQCQTPPVEYRFCFSPRLPSERAQISDGTLCIGASKNSNGKSAQASTTTTTTTTTKNPADSHGVVKETKTVTTKAGAGTAMAVTGQIAKKSNVGSITLSPAFIKRLVEVAKITNAAYPSTSSLEYEQFRTSLPYFAGGTIIFTVNTRSTEGILYYLGQIVRHQLDSNNNASPRLYKIKTEKSFVARRFSGRPCYQDEEDPNFANYPFYCDNFFVLDTGVAPSPLSVVYKGERYAVPQDTVRAGDTMHVLSIVKQLMAVNTSAKSLPQTNVLTVISQ